MLFGFIGSYRVQAGILSLILIKEFSILSYWTWSNFGLLIKFLKFFDPVHDYESSFGLISWFYIRF